MASLVGGAYEGHRWWGRRKGIAGGGIGRASLVGE